MKVQLTVVGDDSEQTTPGDPSGRSSADVSEGVQDPADQVQTTKGGSQVGSVETCRDGRVVKQVPGTGSVGEQGGREGCMI